jgi:hypothetical protein
MKNIIINKEKNSNSNKLFSLKFTFLKAIYLCDLEQ